jgi:hypothetical protein
MIEWSTWAARVRRWGWIKHHETGRWVGFVAAGCVAVLDVALPPKDESGYPIAEGATFPLTVRTDSRECFKHGQAGGLRLRIPPVASRRTRSVFLGLLYRPMWNSAFSRLTPDGRTARRRARERRKRPERVLGYEPSRWYDGVSVSDFERRP